MWRYLTEAELRSRMVHGRHRRRRGGKFDLLVDHDRLSDDARPLPGELRRFKGKTGTEQVVRFEPPRLLETTFQGGRNGTVTYELTAEGERTKLVLTHRGIVSATGAQDFGSGWTSHLAVLEERLAGRGVRDSGRSMPGRARPWRKPWANAAANSDFINML